MRKNIDEAEWLIGNKLISQIIWHKALFSKICLCNNITEKSGADYVGILDQLFKDLVVVDSFRINSTLKSFYFT